MLQVKICRRIPTHKVSDNVPILSLSFVVVSVFNDGCPSSKKDPHGR
jgi:hypothetical protein